MTAFAAPAATIATEITVAFGPSTTTYALYVTTARPDYDGFGTLTVYDAGEGGERWVLIDVEHRQWQISRYLSGCKSAEPSDALTADELARRLRDAMKGGLALEAA